MIEQLLVYGGNLGTGRTIDKNRIENIHLDNRIANLFGCTFYGRSFQYLLIVVEGNTFTTEDRLPGIGKTYDIDT